MGSRWVGEWGEWLKAVAMVSKIMNRLFNKRQLEKLSEMEIEEGAKKRQQIIQDAQMMKRLLEGVDFQRFIELLKQDMEGLNNTLLNIEAFGQEAAEMRIRLIARINQIERVINKPKSLVWQMENLTEVRDAIKQQTRERQALGNKTGGER